LDLCWGRYDTNDHPINEPVSGTDNPEYLFPGIDYSNARIRDFDKVGEYLKESSQRGKEARMPWHDVHCRIIGPVVADIARHFVQRWNFSKVWTGEGITDIKTNSSVSKEKSKIINAELKVEPKKKPTKKRWSNLGLHQ
jgi:phosphatidylserine/phosphatidylglycerophosphate/cardiolipin synthase-like enzyme